MDFLVTIEVILPHDIDPAEKDRLTAAEHARAIELASAGTIAGMWRIPGRLANVAIWRAMDATEVHAAITSLPLWPYMQVEVTALAEHYLAPHTVFLGGSGPA